MAEIKSALRRNHNLKSHSLLMFMSGLLLHNFLQASVNEPVEAS